MKITIYGASDDLVEVEGDISEEWAYRESDEGSFLGLSDGTLLTIEYDRNGMWRINRIVNGAATFAKTEATDADKDYSDRVTLEGDFAWIAYGNVARHVAR